MIERGEKKEAMNCAEFHKVLPFMIEDGKLEQDEHLQSCPKCAELVADLRYIADQAKLLLPMHDPNPRVWNSIQSNLEKEGLTSGRMPRLGLMERSTQKNRWSPMMWAAGLAAMLLVTVGVFQINRPQDNPVSHVAAGNSSAASSDEDAQLLLAVAQRSPALKQIYESNLKSVNAYISDARSSVEKDPEDSQAREHLREAYAQKAMLYDMATSRSLE